MVTNSKKTNIMMRIGIIAAGWVAAVLLLTGCQTASTLTFHVETGDYVDVELNTTSGNYKLTSDGGAFQIYKKEDSATSGKLEILSAEGNFMLTENNDWQKIYDDVEAEESAAILEEGTTEDGDEYVIINYADQEFFCCINLHGSDTGVKLAADTKETLKETMDILHFSASKEKE